MRLIKDYLLILKIRAGDTEAWEILVNQYYDPIYSFCYRRCFGNKALAEDLTQEVFLKLVKHIHKIRFTGKFFNYLFTIAVNTCNNYYTKKTLETTELHEGFSDKNLPTFDQTLIQQEVASEIQQVLNTLPDIQKEALILKYFYQMKVKEIAKITNTSVPTAQSRINQGLKKMKRLMTEEDQNED